MRIRYNSPVVLTFTFVCIGVTVATYLTGGHVIPWLSVDSGMDFKQPLSYVKLISYVITHLDVNHLAGNILLIMLIGPILEEKYGSKSLFYMMFFTAVVTGLLQSFIFTESLVGASGIVFMLIVLSSFTNMQKGDIPLTFLLVMAIYITQEFIRAQSDDNISQFAHILGGLVGGVFGFFLSKKPKPEAISD